MYFNLVRHAEVMPDERLIRLFRWIAPRGSEAFIYPGVPLRGHWRLLALAIARDEWLQWACGFHSMDEAPAPGENSTCRYSPSRVRKPLIPSSTMPAEKLRRRAHFCFVPYDRSYEFTCHGIVYILRTTPSLSAVMIRNLKVVRTPAYRLVTKSRRTPKTNAGTSVCCGDTRVNITSQQTSSFLRLSQL